MGAMFRKSCCCIGIGADTEELFNALKLARKKRNAMTDKQYNEYDEGKSGVNLVYIKPISPMFPVPTLGSDKSNETVGTNTQDKHNSKQSGPTTVSKCANAGESKTDQRRKYKQRSFVTQPI